MRIPVALLALTLLAPFPAAAQEGTATPTAASPLATLAPEEIVVALEEAEAPATLPGNTTPEIVLVSWEEHYGETLNGAIGAWVMTGSTELPLASIVVFPSSENAKAGLGDFRRDSSLATAGELDAWVIANRDKWVCVAVDGPVLIIGQAEPADAVEDPDAVRERSCAVTAATHAWLLETVGLDTEATPKQ